MAGSKKRAKSQAKKRDTEYTRRLNELRRTGAYVPKNDELTPYKKRRINAVWRTVGKYIEPEPAGGKPKKFFFVDTDKLTKKERRAFLANAQSLGMPTTKRGIFMEKEGQRKARLAWNAENDEYDVVLTGKVKWGENRGKKISDRIPIGPVDRIGQELERIQNVAKQFGPLKKGEAISFVVMEHGEETGATRETFGQPDADKKLRDYLDTRYHRDNMAAKLRFLRMIRVRKTTPFEWTRDHPQRPKKMAQRGKRPLGYNPH